MGCGTSKAAQVIERDITIKAILSTEHGDRDSSLRSTQGEPTSGESATSEERARTQDQFSHEDSTDRRDIDSDQPAATDDRPRYDAFDVCLETPAMKAPPPRRLSKLESVPKLTSEMLAEKQRRVDERKAQELERRASRGLSRKDRLRRQIIEARDMEMGHTLTGEEQSASTMNRGTGPAETQHKRGEHEKGVRGRALQLSTGELDHESGAASYDPSVEMDVDLTYNTENLNEEFWDTQSSENNSSTANPKTSTHPHDPDDIFHSKSEQFL